MSNAVGKFTGSFTLRPVRVQPAPRGGWLIRWAKILLGGLGNPNLKVFQSDPDDPFTYTGPDGRVFTIDFAFETDGATTPRILWWIPGFAPNDFEYGAYFHDSWFEAHHMGADVVDFDEANRRLGEMAQALGVSPAKARWIERVCRWVGHGLWDYHYDPVTGEPDYARPVRGLTSRGQIR